MVKCAGTVLVVDDDDAFREGLRVYLESHGYTIAEARDGVDAADQLEQLDCKAVITDYRMPRMDGLELLAIMRQRQNKQVVVFVSGALSEKDEEKAKAYRVHSILRKPFDRWHLLQVLRKAIGVGQP